MTGPLAQLLAAGVVVAVVPIGALWARALGLNPRDRFAMSAALGFAAWSVPLELTAAAGAFSPRDLGIAGWLLAIVSVAWLWRRSSRPSRTPLLAVLLTLAAVAAFLYAGFPNESLQGSRDEGLYTLGGLALHRTGTLALELPVGYAEAGQLAAPYVDRPFMLLPGLFIGTAALEYQFPPLLPAWIAQLYATAGDAGLYRTNALFALAALLCFYRLACRFAAAPIALTATAVFALNPAQVWIARTNLSEPLAQLMFVSALLLLTGAGRHRLSHVASAALLAAVVALVRIEAVILPLLLVAAAVLFSAQGPRRRRAAIEYRNAGFALACAQALALALLWHTNRMYLMINATPIVATALALAAAAAVLWLSPRVLPDGLSPGVARALAWVLMLALIGAFAYAAVARPYIEPFALIDKPGSNLHGSRNHREDALANLAAYIGWVTLLLTLAGAAIAARRALLIRGRATTTWMSISAVGVLCVVLADPRVSPDHVWAARRFIPLVIPLALILAAWAYQALLVAVGVRQFGVPALAAGAFMTIMLLLVQQPTLLTAENAGLTRQFRALDASLPAGRVLVRDLDGVATTLMLGFGRDVLPWRDELRALGQREADFIAGCAQRTCTLLHTTFAGLGGLSLGASRSFTLERTFIAPTMAPLARTFAHDRIPIRLTPVAGLQTGPVPGNGGVPHDFRIPERGLFRDELGPAGTARWTAGNAQFDLPPTTADTLELRLAVALGRAQPARIRLDDRIIHVGALAPGAHVLRIPFAAVSGTARSRVTIESSTFIPEVEGLGPDPRGLGLLVQAIRRIDSRTPLLAADSPPAAYRSDIALVNRNSEAAIHIVVGGPPVPLVLRVEQRGTTAWPAQPKDGLPVVTLGVRWLPPAGGPAIAEQRILLPYDLHPTEHWWLAPMLGTDLPPAVVAGDYVVEIGFVQEGITWFVDRGDRSLRLRAQVAAAR